MKKVTIEITENGFETKLELGEKTYIEKQEITKGGAIKIEGDFENVKQIKDTLYFPLELCSSDCLCISEALKELK